MSRAESIETIKAFCEKQYAPCDECELYGPCGDKPFEEMHEWEIAKLLDKIKKIKEKENEPLKFVDSTGINWEVPDSVNHPQHYASTSIECIDAMIETQGKEAVRAFCVCNAFKYLWRHNNKNGDEDVKKANWYLNKAVELM
jgi:hypothetical protein